MKVMNNNDDDDGDNNNNYHNKENKFAVYEILFPLCVHYHRYKNKYVNLRTSKQHRNKSNKSEKYLYLKLKHRLSKLNHDYIHHHHHYYSLLSSHLKYKIMFTNMIFNESIDGDDDHDNDDDDDDDCGQRNFTFFDFITDDNLQKYDDYNDDIDALIEKTNYSNSNVPFN